LPSVPRKGERKQKEQQIVGPFAKNGPVTVLAEWGGGVSRGGTVKPTDTTESLTGMRRCPGARRGPGSAGGQAAPLVRGRAQVIVRTPPSVPRISTSAGRRAKIPFVTTPVIWFNSASTAAGSVRFRL